MLLQAKRGRGEMRHLHGGNLQSTGTVQYCTVSSAINIEWKETCTASYPYCRSSDVLYLCETYVQYGLTDTDVDYILCFPFSLYLI